MSDCFCPPEYPQWHRTHVDLGGRYVFESGLPMFFHMPMSYDLLVTQTQDKIRYFELKETWPGLILVKSALFRGKMLRLLESGDSPSSQVCLLSKPFTCYGLIHEGDVGSIRDSLKQVQHQLIHQGLMPKELYMAYLTCPRCEQEKGGHRILLLRRYRANERLRQQANKSANH